MTKKYIEMIKPKKLKSGDTIAIVAPSASLGALFPHRVQNAVIALTKLGFKVITYPTTEKNLDGNAGTPEERAKDLQNAFENVNVRAIICNIGGITSNQILKHLNFKSIRKNPKIFCGYSDITILHYALAKKASLTTFYGPCAMTQFGEYPKPLSYTVEYFLKSLTKSEPIGEVLPSEEWTDEVLDWKQKLDLTRPRKLKFNDDAHIWIKKGNAKGKIIGGCLYSLLQLKSTKYDLDYKDKILFIETPEGQDFSKGETLSYVDSQITDLTNADIFDKIKGLIVGRGFGYTKEEREKFKQIVEKHTNDYNFPVLFNVNIGHTDPIITLPINIEVTLDSDKNKFVIEEAGVI